ncbi:MAG: GNAT family N-acetyltransferase [Lachnospiraceae bacterium]|nr:GNAT family N-acetyltransferase [Lachnospiraceae bacterium]
MQLYITTDSGDILTIGDGDDSFITMRVTGKEADILSITVPEDKRRQGIGTGLLKAAEKTLSERGIFFIYADHLGSIEGLREFLIHNGYESSEGTAIIDIKGILKQAHPVLEKLKKRKITGLKPVHLEDFEISKWDELLDFLSGHGVNMTCFDLAFMDQRISTVIYDQEDRICSVILGSVSENNIYLALLLSRTGAENKSYTFAALKCIVMDISTLMDKKDYDKVLLPACNSGVTSFIKNIPDVVEDRILSEVSYETYKGITKSSYNDMEPAITETDESTGTEWMRALARNPMQYIISWKVPWYRSSQDHGNGQ